MHKEALALLRTAIRQDPNNANAWYNLGVTMYALGNYRMRAMYLAKLPILIRILRMTRFNKGMAPVDLDKNPEALRAFERALQIDPRDLEARNQRDRVLEKLSVTPKGTSPHEPHTQQVKLS